MRAFRLLLCCALCLTLASGALALESVPGIERVEVTAGEDRVAYPQLSGMADEAIQKAVNDDIVMSAGIPSRLVTLNLLRPGGFGLIVDYEYHLAKDVLSVVISARGTMANNREGQAYSALCYDLRTGARMSARELFSDWEGALAYMEAELTRTLPDELSGYLEYADYLPIPVEQFSLDANGITFYYPFEQFSLLSGYCGACQFQYGELAAYLDPAPDGLPARVGAGLPTGSLALLAEGRLPGIPVAIGEAMPDVVARYRLLRDPDHFPGGRYFQLESPAFRMITLLSDEMTDGWEGSVVTGIHARRLTICGLVTGKSVQSDCRAWLGEPESTVAFDEALAYAYGLPAGSADFYTVGAYQLRMYFGSDGVLYSVQLSR